MYVHYNVKRENGTPPQNHAHEMKHLSLDMEHQDQQVQWRRESTGSLQQRIQPKRDISDIAS